jgi:hypothetical protein
MFPFPFPYFRFIRFNYFLQTPKNWPGNAVGTFGQLCWPIWHNERNVQPNLGTGGESAEKTGGTQPIKEFWIILGNFD